MDKLTWSNKQKRTQADYFGSPEKSTHFGGVPLDINDRSISNPNPLLTTGFRFLLTRTPNISYFCQAANIPDVNLGEWNNQQYLFQSSILAIHLHMEI